MNAKELTDLVEYTEELLGFEHECYRHAAECLRGAALDAVAGKFNGPAGPPVKAKRPKGSNAHERQERSFAELNRKPRAPKRTPSTALADVRRTESPDTREAVDATATEDVFEAVRSGLATAVDVANDTHLPITTVSRILAKLTRSGAVVKSGTRRGCRYALPGAEKQTALGLPA